MPPRTNNGPQPDPAGYTQLLQAAYLQDMLTTWRTLDYTGPAFVYTLQDTDTGSTDPEATFGVIRSDGTWKPAAYVIQALASSPATTPVMARMALATPEAALVAPSVAPEPQTPVAAAMTVAMTTLAAASQVAGTTLRGANAVDRPDPPKRSLTRRRSGPPMRPVRPTSRGRRGPTGADDRSGDGQAGQTTRLPRRARDRMSQR
jgi:hypothetical protein